MRNAFTTQASVRASSRKPSSSSAAPLSGRRSGRPSTTSSLTRREREVGAYIVRGYRDKEIAEAMCITHESARVYVARIRIKLDVSGCSRVALARHLYATLSGRPS